MPQDFIADTSPSDESRPKSRSTLIRDASGIARPAAEGMPEKKIAMSGPNETPFATRSMILKTPPSERTKVMAKSEPRKTAMKLPDMYLLIIFMNKF